MVPGILASKIDKNEACHVVLTLSVTCAKMTRVTMEERYVQTHLATGNSSTITSLHYINLQQSNQAAVYPCTLNAAGSGMSPLITTLIAMVYR
jgi:hypothetical protein